jgi:nickel-dependent lactate racemase
VPNELLLSPIVSELEAAGISRSHITILIATGLHRPAPEDEKRFIIGDTDLYDSIKVENHHAQDDAAHLRLGTTTKGTPILIDRRFVEADIKVVTGLIEPHWMAGYSGGRKLIVPGLAHRETIMAFHSPVFMEHPQAHNCILDGNPLCEDQLEVVDMLDGEIFGVNVVIDEGRRLVAVTSGSLLESHLEAVDAARKLSEIPIPQKFFTIVTSAGGFPLDKTYYQTIKGMYAPLDILLPGGSIVLVSECSEGWGSKQFIEAQKLLNDLGPEGFVKRISGPTFPAIIDQWQTEKLAQTLQKARIFLHSPNLGEEKWSLTCVEKARTAEEAVAESMERSGDKNVAVIPEGPYVIPFYSPTKPS